jgi:hypothetical protein
MAATEPIQRKERIKKTVQAIEFHHNLVFPAAKVKPEIERRAVAAIRR